MIGLGRFGSDTSWALEVNNAGEIVGSSDTGGGTHSQAAFLWQAGEMLDLNLLADTGGRIICSWAKASTTRGSLWV